MAVVQLLNFIFMSLWPIITFIYFDIPIKTVEQISTDPSEFL